MSERNNDIECVIDKLIEDVSKSVEKPKKEKCKYVRVLKSQRLIYYIINMIYYVFSKYNLIEYQVILNVENIFCSIDNKKYKLNSKSIKLFDNCFKLYSKLTVSYEYIKSIHMEDSCLIIDFIPNERNVSKVYIQTNNDTYLFNKIKSNMNYHVRYNPIDQNAIKYYQKFYKTPLEVY